LYQARRCVNSDWFYYAAFEVALTDLGVAIGRASHPLMAPLLYQPFGFADGAAYEVAEAKVKQLAKELIKKLANFLTVTA
jgi:hypothetical protein